MTEQINALNAKTQVKNYWIINTLSSDDCGISYLVEDMNTNKEVLLYEFFPIDLVSRGNNNKLALLLDTNDKEYTWRKNLIIQDIKKLIPLGHPSIVKTLRYFNENETIYCVSEYHKATNLKEYFLQTDKTLSEKKIQKIVFPLVEALHEMQKHNIVHKNINLKSIYITKNSKVLLGDFGLGICNRLNNNDSCAFIPIEQCLMEKQLASVSDIYALGAVLYTLINKKKPVDAKIRNEEIKRGNPDPLVLMKASAKYSESLCITINEALQLYSAQRPKSVTQLNGEYKKELSKIDPNITARIEKNKQVISGIPKSVMRIAIALIIGISFLYIVVEKEKPQGSPNLFEAVEGSVVLNEALDTQLHKSRNAREASRLAYAYSIGQGVKKNPKKAFEWNQKGADEGDVYAMTNLGRAYLFGKGTTKNETQGIKWFKEAADKGFAGGYFELGWAYSKGTGVPKDVDTSIKNFNKSIALNYNYAYGGLGWVYKKDKQYQKAMQAYLQVKGRGQGWAEREIGNLYNKGRGVSKNHGDAMTWYKKAASKGESYAMNHIGRLYQKGEGSVRKSYKDAFHWYEKSAQKGNQYGQANLAMMYERGWGVSKNIEIAIEWYQSAAKKGNKYAKKRLIKLGKV